MRFGVHFGSFWFILVRFHVGYRGEDVIELQSLITKKVNWAEYNAVLKTLGIERSEHETGPGKSS